MNSIFVNTRKVLADTSKKPIGINVNYLRDEDDNNPNGRSLVEALEEMGVGHLRYPGGEKSDFYLFAEPPFTKACPQVHGWYKNKVEGYQLMDFDAFIQKAQAVDAVPHIVVGYDSFERTGITRKRYLQNAVEWVRYANITKGYGVVYWEIGNENWHNGTGNPKELAAVVTEFSRAMKQVDPSIKVGASGNSKAWWCEFLPGTAAEIDFLTVSQYSCMDWKSYDYYAQHSEIGLIEQAKNALQAIDEYVPQHSDRLKVVICELNSMDYSEGGWAPDNNLGHALVTFEIIGQLLTNPRIDYGMIWNTRWIDEKKPDVLWYALGADNELLPPGRILSIWGQFLGDRMVEISSTAQVIAYASLYDDKGQLTLFLLNKSLTGQKVSIQIVGRRYAAGETYRLEGKGPDDKYPSWQMCNRTEVVDNILEGLSLPAVSLTVIQLWLAQ